MNRAKYGPTFKFLKSVFTYLGGTQKQLKVFVNEKMLPLSKEISKQIEISDEDAFNLIKEEYPAWIEKNRMTCFNDIRGRIEEKTVYVPGLGYSYDMSGMRIHPIVEY